ncbi:MAG: hypothetical protein NPIRA01_08140 [Nitrospirales bacterium]|nr:MAG: hypothetical protein NPIRA01_08140 [Nitrospirales bacterium]
MKCIVIFLVTVNLLASSALADNFHDDSAFLIRTLLNIENSALMENGQYNGLKEYKAWGALYERYHESAQSKSDLHSEGLKVFLFIGYVAHARLQAATSESFTSDLMPIYLTRQDSLWEILRENPFLVPSTCHYLGAFFGFEERHVEGKPAFLSETRPIIKQALPHKEAELCIKRLEEAKNS